MRKQKDCQNNTIYHKWPFLLPNIRCRDEATDIFLLSTLALNKATINRTIDIISEIAKCLKLSNKVVRNKIILLKRDLMTIKNSKRMIYRRQDELQPLDKLYWFGFVASLYYLEMNLLSMLFDKF